MWMRWDLLNRTEVPPSQSCVGDGWAPDRGRTVNYSCLHGSRSSVEFHNGTGWDGTETLSEAPKVESVAGVVRVSDVHGREQAMNLPTREISPHRGEISGARKVVARQMCSSRPCMGGRVLSVQVARRVKQLLAPPRSATGSFWIRGGRYDGQRMI